MHRKRHSYAAPHSAHLPHPSAHGPTFHLALQLALRSMHALATLTLHVFDADLLAVVPPMLDAEPHLVRLDVSSDFTAVLAPGRLVRHLTLRVASTLYAALGPVALFDVMGNRNSYYVGAGCRSSDAWAVVGCG
jgi:hypothetical protein